MSLYTGNLQRLCRLCPGMMAAVLLSAALSGCGAPTKMLRANRGTAQQLYREETQGAVVCVLTPHSIVKNGVPDGLERALQQASREAPCSAAAFDYRHRDQALVWIQTELRKRRQRGHGERLVLAGHSWGATASGELAKQLLRLEKTLVLQLLITVDAIKSGTVGATTGITTTLLTLNNPIPGKDVYFTAYDGTPPVDGRRVLAHINYYQGTPALAHGGPIRSASENHRIATGAETGINHGNVDDYVYPLVLGDLAHAVRKGMLP